MIHLLKAIIPIIKTHNNKTGKRGAILITSSISGVYPFATQSVYNGTKAFNDHFGMAVGI